MFGILHQFLHVALLLCAGGSLIYLLFAMASVSRFASKRTRVARERAPQPPVTVLKPVCGMEPSLYENLRSFCEQNYSEFQVIFAVADERDPAVDVVRRLISELPGRDLELCIDPMEQGTNRKVSNLANACRNARHDFIIVADSDMHVGPDYLAAVAAEFADPQVGAVTCLYSGRSGGGLASDLGALFINEWFLPSALVAQVLQPLRYCFGATMGVRRGLLDRIGGFNRLATTLADDHMLGRLVADLGYRVNLVPYLVENVVEETGMGGLVAHELRWAKTVRAVQPVGYTFSFISYAVPVALANLALAPMSVSSWVLLLTALGLRIFMHELVQRRLGVRGPDRLPSLWQIPLRDMLSFGIWAAAFFGRTVSWKEHTFSVDANGNLALRESQAP